MIFAIFAVSLLVLEGILKYDQMVESRIRKAQQNRLPKAAPLEDATSDIRNLATSVAKHGRGIPPQPSLDASVHAPHSAARR
jgi:hypothetical protein